MDNIKEQLANLTELSDESLGEIETGIVAQFDTFAESDLSAQTVDAMTELADMLDTVRGEVSRREAEREELAKRATELSNRVKGAEESVADEPAEESAPDTEGEAIEASAATETEEEIPADETPTTEPATEASVEEVAATEAPAEAEAAIEEVAEVEAPAETEAAIDEVEAPAETVEVAEAPEDTATEASADVEEASAEEVPAEEEVAAEAEAAAEAPTEAEASNTETIEPEEAQEEASTVTAAATESFEAPAERRPEIQVSVPTVAITAGADIPGVTAGTTLSPEGVAQAFSDRLHTLRRANGGDGEQHIVASYNTEYPDDRQLFGTAEENWDKIAEAKEEHHEALVAAGGYGTPLETRYDIFGFGTDARPVKDSLPKFQANRGGIRFVRPPVLSSYANAVGVWTEANDIAAASNDGDGGDVVKNVLVVAGATEATASLDAVTLQLQVGNLLARAYPELVARHNELALIQHAREAELNLLAKIQAASTAVTTTSTIGFARDFLVNVRRAAAGYRSRHRIAPDTNLQAIIPMWVVDAVAADLALAMPGDDKLSVAWSEIRGFLSALNVTMTASYDQNTFGAQSSGALLEFPDAFTWYLFSEGSFLFLDGGTLDIGIVRDSGLVGTNDYRMFVETFEGLAFVGIESLAITSTIVVNGAAAALVTPVDY